MIRNKIVYALSKYHFFKVDISSYSLTEGNNNIIYINLSFSLPLPLSLWLTQTIINNKRLVTIPTTENIARDPVLTSVRL